MSSGKYKVEGWAKYTDNGAKSGHEGSFEGSNDKIGETLARSVPSAGGRCAETAGDMINKKYGRD